MNAAWIVVLVILGLVFGFLVFNSGYAAREGSYRAGPSWYLDVSTPRETLMPGAFGENPRERVSRRVILTYEVMGAALAITAVVMVGIGDVAYGIWLGFFAFLSGGLAVDGIRRNHRADRAAEERQDPRTGAGPGGRLG